MEQDQCWIQTKRKYSMSSNSNLVNSSLTIPPSSSSCYGDSWEEQAFAEDAAAGSLGGCIWPPRSYSCSFCRREFRSAQALGGHMNVHRKDRARLKQQSPNDQILFHHHHHNHHELEIENHHHLLQKPLIQSDHSYLAYNSSLFPNSPPCGLVYNKTNPNSNSHPDPSSASKDLFREETLISPFNSSESWMNLPRDDRLCSTKYQEHEVDEKVSKGILDSRLRGKGENDDESDVSMSLNLVLYRTHPLVELDEKTNEEDFNCKKRMKIDSSSNQLFSNSKSTFDNQKRIEAKMFEFSPNSIEELDLELRLGTRSKV